MVQWILEGTAIRSKEEEDVLSEQKACTNFTIIDYDDWDPCRCPECKGFLPKDFPIGGQFLCRKCGSVLETLPSPVDDSDEDEDSDMEFGGIICKVPDYAIKISTELSPKALRHRKKKTNKWAMGVGFARRVWKDKGGEFVEVYPERIELDDSRILQVVEGEK